jgi:hypothetical protein
LVAERQIDPGSSQKDGAWTFDGFWLAQASTQTPWKVPWKSAWIETEAEKAIQDLPKSRLIGSSSTHSVKLIGDVEG